VLRRAISLALLVTAAGCTYHGPAQDDPIQRRLTWYSYLNSDDLRSRCVPGAAAEYRFVYNGVYIQQVRSYDIAAVDPAGGRYRLRARVIGPADLSEVGIRPQFPAMVGDIFAPWMGTIEEVPLTAADIGKLDQALAQSGFAQPAPRGLYLRGEDFFWIVGACSGGTFHFNAYKYPSPQFEAAKFPPLLLAWDPTGIPINPARSLSPFEIYGQASPEPGDSRPTYTLTVGDNGLAAVRPLF
jgi:hypothetical protein